MTLIYFLLAPRSFFFSSFLCFLTLIFFPTLDSRIRSSLYISKVVSSLEIDMGQMMDVEQQMKCRHHINIFFFLSSLPFFFLLFPSLSFPLSCLLATNRLISSPLPLFLTSSLPLSPFLPSYPPPPSLPSSPHPHPHPHPPLPYLIFHPTQHS